MKAYSIHFVSKQIKTIPKKLMCLWVLILITFAYSLVSLLTPTFHSLEMLQECTIECQEVKWIPSGNKLGSRWKLELTSEGITYYVWYPPTKFLSFESKVDRDLLSGEITRVQIKIPKQQSIRDMLFHQRRVVEIKSQTDVYYDLDTERLALREQNISNIVLFVFSTIILLGITVYILLVYKIVKFQKKTIRNNTDK